MENINYLEFNNPFDIPNIFNITKNGFTINRNINLISYKYDPYFYLLLKKNNLEKYYKIFEKYRINYNKFILCTDDYFKLLEIPIGPRIRLRVLIIELKNNMI